MLIYSWLIHNHLWPAVVSWFVGILLGAMFSWIPFKKHLRKQNDIADKLDTKTPGGMRDIALLLAALQDGSKEKVTDLGGEGEGS